MLQGAASSDCGCKLLHSSRLVIKMFTVERDYLKTQPFVQFGSLMMQISAASSLPLACVLLSTYSDITHCFVVSFLKPRVQPSPRWAAGSHVSFIPYFTLNWTTIHKTVLNKWNVKLAVEKIYWGHKPKMKQGNVFISLKGNSGIFKPYFWHEIRSSTHREQFGESRRPSEDI